MEKKTTKTTKAAKTVKVVKAVKPMAPHRSFTGEIVSVSGQKTVRVLVKSIKMHQKYRKQYTVSRKFAVHDERNEGKIGALVEFEECRPMSKTKRWRLTRVVR